MTVLIGKENEVTANFALVQPSLQADGVRIAKSLAEASGADEPTLEDFDHFPYPSSKEIEACKTHGMMNFIKDFSSQYDRKVKGWQRTMQKLNQQRRNVAVWGAGSKGVTFLNTLENRDQIEYVVDINPNKQGMYVAGTGQEIISPERLRTLRPDVLIVMNPGYKNEIQNMAARLGLETDLLCA